MKTVQLRIVAMLMLFLGVSVGAAIWLHVVYEIPLQAFTQDPTSFAGVPPYVGVLSSLGIMFWAAAVTAGLIGAMNAKSLGQEEEYRFAIAGAAFSLVLAADDALQLHDAILPRVGIGEEIVFAFYGVVALCFWRRFNGIMAARGGWVFYLSIAALGASVIVDLLAPQVERAIFVEDVAKLVGVGLWAVFFVVAVEAPVGGATLANKPKGAGGAVICPAVPCQQDDLRVTVRRGPRAADLQAAAVSTA